MKTQHTLINNSQLLIKNTIYKYASLLTTKTNLLY